MLGAYRLSLKSSPFLLVCLFFLIVPCVRAQTAEKYLQSGNDFYKEDNFDQAIYAYTKAIDINPNLARAYNNRGVAYARENSMSRAIADFTMAIANNLNDAEAYNNRGHAYVEQGNLSQAIADYTQAVNINSLYTKAYKNRCVLYFKMKEYDKAWADVFKVEELGGTIDRDFYIDLKNAIRQAKPKNILFGQ